MGDRRGAQDVDVVKVTICFNGKEKKIPLVVQPSPQLSDVQLELAFDSLTRLVQQIFKITDSRGFTLRDSHSYSKLNKNSFRQEHFPLKWNVVYDKCEANDAMIKHGGVLYPPLHGHSSEVLPTRTSYHPARHHMMSHEILSSTRSDPFGGNQMTFPVDMGKNVYIISENGSYGFLLRHFSIRESHEPSQETELRATSPDSERMSTVFVYKLQPNGPAQQAGLNEGDKVYSINGHLVTRCSLDQVEQLLRVNHQGVVLQVSPKADDVLQLFRYAPLAYGPSGEHMTKLGRAWVYDVNAFQCSDWLKDDDVSNHGSWSSAHDHMVTPSGSTSSHDMVTPPATHLSSSENSSRYASPMANSPVIGGSHGSSGSRLLDDVYITGSLSQIPVSPTTSLSEWALDREDSQSPVSAHVRTASPLLRQLSGVTNDPHPSGVGTTLSTGATKTISPHPPEIATVYRRSPDPYSSHGDSSDVTDHVPSHEPFPLDCNKSSSYTILDQQASYYMKTSLQYRAASSPSLDHSNDYTRDMVSSQVTLPTQKTSSSSCGSSHDAVGRTTAANRRGIKLSLEDLTRIEPSREVTAKRRSREEQSMLSNGDMADEHVERQQTLSPIEDSLSSLAHSQDTSISGEFNYRRTNKTKSYSSQRERLHRSLSKPLTGASQSTSSQGSYSLDCSLSSDHIAGKSPTAAMDTSQTDYSMGSSQEFTRQRANSFKKYLENSLHEAFPSLDDDDEEPTSLEVKTVQQDDRGGYPKFPPGHDHVVNQLSKAAGHSPGTSPMKPHRIVAYNYDSDSSLQRPMERTKSHTIELDRVFSDGLERRHKSSGSLFANKRHASKQSSVDDQLLSLHETKSSDSLMLKQACCHGLLYRKLEKEESGKRAHDRSWKCFYCVVKDNHLFFYKDRSDIDQNKLPDDTPIDVASALADIAHNYTKRKFVFRLTTQSGAEMLLQAEDQASLLSWVKAIQTCSEEGLVQKGGRDARTALIIKKKKQMKSPSSPPPTRKATLASPTTGRKKVSSSKSPGEGGGRLAFLDLIKNSLRLHRSRNSDEPDSSSYITFGVDLEQCPASIENKLVPLVVEFIIHHIEDHGLDSEGLYRVSGTHSTVNKLIAEINRGNYHHDFGSEQWGDVHNFTSLLKAFFNDLPDPIIPSNMYSQFVAAAKEHDFNRLYTMKGLIYRLPPCNKNTLKFLLAHLRTVHQHVGVNKMTMKNLCIVFGPTLMRCPVHEVGPSYVIMELLLKNMDSFFEDVHLTREPIESATSDRLLPKQLNADKQLNVDRSLQRVLSPRSQTDVRVVTTDTNSSVGSIWKKHKTSRSDDTSGLATQNSITTLSSIATQGSQATQESDSSVEGRVVNIDEAIAIRHSILTDDRGSQSDYLADIPVNRNSKQDRHGNSHRNHRLMGDTVLLDHALGVAIDSSSSNSVGTNSSDEHVFRNYFDNSWDQLRQQKMLDQVDSEPRAHSVNSSYSTHLESDL